MLLGGLYTALVTPFSGDKLALADFRNLVETQSDGGVDGVVVGGTTGEAPVLTREEFVTLIGIANEVAGTTKVIAGVGSCDTKQAVEKTKIAHDLGVYGMLAVTPYYNKSTQSGLIEYYGRIADATDRPIILYSVPSRTGVEIAVETAARLHERHRNIVAIKEASENCSRVEEMVRVCGEGFSVLSGNDSMTIPFMSLGATGVVSVMSNLMPLEMANIVASACVGDFRRALMAYRSVLPVMSKLFIETNPLPVKFLLKAKGVISSEKCRSPIGELSKKSIGELSNLTL
ncbi:MAG: 4-hydroxy-tetrahydrodipicolinate synthase [Puniceicoccales bacterium]|jgi:4-hydroxy-tetrahydrodipicolinate synthase|nr:4-hydroxy-tetrahydrodipicolinate synthase [Puniceicoccales bacterium]